MSYKFVSIQGTYNKIELALFNDAACIDVCSKNDVKASSHLIPLLDFLLQKNNLILKDLSFIAVDKGPGAFTSLRVTISTVNGLSFASQLPLIGVNSLEALARQVLLLNFKKNKRPVMVVCLLNAYNDDVYYLFDPEDKVSSMGCKKIDDVLAELIVKSGDYNLLFAGNGFELHRELIMQSLFQDFAIIPICSAESIGNIAYEYWLSGQEIVDQVSPFYLKTQLFALKK